MATNVFSISNNSRAMYTLIIAVLSGPVLSYLGGGIVRTGILIIDRSLWVCGCLWIAHRGLLGIEPGVDVLIARPAE